MELWGQDTVRADTFWGVLNVSLRAYGAQHGYISQSKQQNLIRCEAVTVQEVAMSVTVQVENTMTTVSTTVHVVAKTELIQIG